MDNRRQHYRHTLDAGQRMQAVFQSPDANESFSAAIVNLSIGGMCAIPEANAAVPAGRWLVVFSLDQRKMQMTAERVYSDPERSGHCGFRFLPAADPKRREGQEQAIWSFLLEKQRQERRQAREAKRLTG